MDFFQQRSPSNLDVGFRVTQGDDYTDIFTYGDTLQFTDLIRGGVSKLELKEISDKISVRALAANGAELGQFFIVLDSPWMVNGRAYDVTVAELAQHSGWNASEQSFSFDYSFFKQTSAPDLIG
jgi:hypothetical protein